ncbi:MAG: HEAT repeat domain-containing protein [Myxococcota bacterium]
MRGLPKTWLSLLLLLLLAPGVRAATYLVYVPQPIALGGASGEVYTATGFEAHDGLAGAALADAAMAELNGMLREDARALKVEIRGGVATVTAAEDRAEDPAVVDRALGAVFHTLRLAGLDEIRLGDEALSPSSFSRGALLPVLPLASALPPRELAYGYVLLDGRPVPAAEFNRRVAGGHASIRKAIADALSRGTTPVKLSVLASLDGVRVSDPLGLLIPRLEDEDPAVRLAVLEAVEGRRDARLLDALERVVDTDPNSEAKIAAARILVDAGRSAYKKYLLLEKLRSSDASVVIEAAGELIATGDDRLAPALAELVRHNNPEVRAIGVDALREFERFDLMTGLVGDSDVNRDVAQPLARTLADEAKGQRRAAGLAWLLREGDREQAVHAANVVASERVPGTTEALGEALKRAEPEVRSAAAQALGALRDTAALEPLAEAVRQSSEDEERDLFTEQAIRIIAVQPLDQVIKISESPDVTIRQLAVKSLAEFARDRPNPRVLSVLRKHLKDDEDAIRRAAAYALARIDDPTVVEDLVALKGDEDPVVRQQVALALTGGKHPEAESILLSYLDDPDNRVKLQAVKAVRKRQMAAAFDKLKWMSEYRHTEIRREVMKALITLAEPGDEALFDLYQQRLYDEDPQIRISAIEALSQYEKDARVVTVIGGAVTDQDKQVKLKALEVLSRSDDANAVEQVVRGLFDTDTEIKMAALDALERLGSPKAIQALQEFVLNEDDAAVKTRANEVLNTL